MAPLKSLPGGKDAPPKSFGKSAFEAPQNAPEPRPAPLVIRHHSWPREVWALMVFFAGLCVGVTLTLIATTSMFDPIAKNNLQVLVAKHTWEKTDGR